MLLILEKNKNVFNRTLDKWKNIQYNIKLKKLFLSPIIYKFYSAPVLRIKILILEIKIFCKIGVLKKLIILNNKPSQYWFLKKI